MTTLSEAQLKIMPEVSELLHTRYRFLQMIEMLGPIGRRGLADNLSVAEREARKETDLLREQGLIVASRSGMRISELGMEVLEVLKPLVYEWSGISTMEKQLTRILGIQKVIIVDGDLDEIPSIKSLLGLEATKQLELVAGLSKIVAVTGGSTLAAIADSLTPSEKLTDLTFIAARGGMGVEMRLQANTIAATFAGNTDNTYRTLYLPEHLSETAYNAIIQEPIVKEMIELYDQTDVVIHGIGSALEMAVRRDSSEQEKQALLESGAISEAFGYYFDEQGNAVQRIRTVGIQLEQVNRCKSIIAVAGGKNKAKAILSYFKHGAKQSVLITDSAAAEEMLHLLQ
ncbi:sugar-binding transcriptional regulator [Rummeliibacillus sp. NPDC094406]|uniref:sugar-binding transcriptional regulator n=1 Tax=Rummeliibacillus sp. NPDC094406 TaxID=3364511 RepID=UPI0037FD2F06